MKIIIDPFFWESLPEGLWKDLKYESKEAFVASAEKAAQEVSNSDFNEPHMAVTAFLKKIGIKDVGKPEPVPLNDPIHDVLDGIDHDN